MDSVQIRCEASLPGYSRKNLAWEILSDFSRYHEYCSAIKEVRIVTRKGNEGISEWIMDLDGAPLSWLQKDVFDVEKQAIRFQAVMGDFKRFAGTWSIENRTGKDIKLLFQTSFKMDIPIIGYSIRDVVREKLESNFNAVLVHLKNQILLQQLEERQFPRVPIERFNDFAINERAVRSYILNISRKGMLFLKQNFYYPFKAALYFGDVRIPTESLEAGNPGNKQRIIFKNSLPDGDFDSIVRNLTSKDIRTEQRKNFNIETHINPGEKPVDIILVNISRLGMQFTYKASLPSFGSKFEFMGLTIGIKAVYQYPETKTARILFSKAIPGSAIFDAVSRGQ